MSTLDLKDGMESLEYWRSRSRRLSWYRFSARREAKEMTCRWEERVRDAVLSQRGIAFGTRIAGGLLLARLRLQGRRVRTGIVVATGVALALMSLPVLLTVVLLTQ